MRGLLVLIAAAIVIMGFVAINQSLASETCGEVCAMSALQRASPYLSNNCTNGLEKIVYWRMNYYPNTHHNKDTDLMMGTCGPNGQTNTAQQCWPQFYQEVFGDVDTPYNAGFLQVQPTAFGTTNTSEAKASDRQVVCVI